MAAGQSVTVRVPATSANLGPGYDSLGLALSLHDTLTVETLDSGELEFDLSGEGADTLPRDASHLVARALTEALHRLGYRHAGLRITADNVNPHGRGLGSSAAAVVAAASAANALVPAADRRGKDWILQFTSTLEGHPDNVAPAISADWRCHGRTVTSTAAPAPSCTRTSFPWWPFLTTNSPPRRPGRCCRRPWGTMPRP